MRLYGITIVSSGRQLLINPEKVVLVEGVGEGEQKQTRIILDGGLEFRAEGDVEHFRQMVEQQTDMERHIERISRSRMMSSI